MSDVARVVVTGLGALTSTGMTADAIWQAVTAGEQGLAPITHWDLSAWPHQLGGEIKAQKLAELLPDRKWMKLISRHDVFGIHAAVQAVEHSGLLPYRDALSCSDTFNDETAIFVGSPGNKYYQQYDFLPLIAKTEKNMQAFASALFSEVHPMWLLRILPNNVLAYVGMTYGFKGVNHNIANHAVGGIQALIEGYHAIRTGQARRAVVVAYDVGIEPQALYYYDRMGVISGDHLKPFDVAHNGTILAEGAVAFVLENKEDADARGAMIHGEMLGGYSATEGEGLFSMNPEGKALATLMQHTLDQLALTSMDIGMVVAHGNGNPQSDVSEACAIHQVFDAHEVPVTAFKWSMGHTLCASGMMDAMLAMYALRDRCVPGIASWDTPAEHCTHLNIDAKIRSWPSVGEHALIINRGFGGMNACVVIKRG